MKKPILCLLFIVLGIIRISHTMDNFDITYKVITFINKNTHPVKVCYKDVEVYYKDTVKYKVDSHSLHVLPTTQQIISVAHQKNEPVKLRLKIPNIKGKTTLFVNKQEETITIERKGDTIELSSKHFKSMTLKVSKAFRQ